MIMAEISGFGLCLFRVSLRNHPSGNPTESTADRALTEHLVKSLQLLNIRLLDHLIVAGSRAISFAEKGFL